MKQCPKCGKLVDDRMIQCPYCFSLLQASYAPGSECNPPQQTTYRQGSDNCFDEGPEGKSRGVCALLAIILGGLGVQYFYLGKIGGGFITILLTIVTCGLWEVVTLIQGILMFCMTNADFRRKYVLSNSTLPLF